MSHGALPFPYWEHFRLFVSGLPRGGAHRNGTRKFDDKLCAFALGRFHADATAMRLQYLVNDG
jgi:hypothetical protein